MNARTAHYKVAASVTAETGTHLISVSPGDICVATYVHIITPSDASSSGTWTIDSDPDAIAGLVDATAPESGTFTAGHYYALQATNGTNHIAQTHQNITIGWTPGNTPGVTAPEAFFTFYFLGAAV